ACSLQACLNKNTYTPDKCNRQMRELYRCCQSFYETTEDKGDSTACPTPNIVRRWLKDHEQT
ncbi:hypothetical protein BXZ70DRAFT_889095, partial [Cristinia sonorae]